MRAASHIVSYLFHPIFLPTAGLLIIFSINSYVAHTTPFGRQIFLVSWIFINTAVIPFLFTAFLRWKRLIKSIHLEEQEDRTIPFAFALFFYFTNYWLLRDITMPTVIYSLFLGSSVAVGLSLLINFFTKISIHMIGMGGLTASIYGVAQLFDSNILALIIASILASGLVGTARYVLESHSLRQIYMGWLIGFTAIYVPVINGWG